MFETKKWDDLAGRSGTHATGKNVGGGTQRGLELANRVFPYGEGLQARKGFSLTQSPPSLEWSSPPVPFEISEIQESENSWKLYSLVS